MGKFLKKYDRDHMKLAMLKQEQTFREQVSELHRLYEVQKQLMTNTKFDPRKQYTRTCEDNQDRSNAWKSLNLERSGGESNEQECEVELTLGIGGKWRKREENSDSGASFSSSSTESGWETLKLQEWRLFQMKDMKMNKDRLQESSWHLECLSPDITL